MQLGRSMITTALLAVLATATYAQYRESGKPHRSDNAEGGYSQAFPAGHTARYVATYMASSTSSGFRTATVVSVTNNSPVSCVVSADWFAGFSGTSACTTTLTLSPGFTGE